MAEGLEVAVRRVAEVLEAQRTSFALIGGLAVSARAAPRFTGDADFAVAVSSEADAEALVFVMQEAGFQPFKVMEDKRDGRLATVRFNSTQRRVVDLLFRFTGIEAEIARGASQALVIGGFLTRVASVGHLLAMKIQAGRPKDLVDLESLLAVASKKDRQLALRAVKRIVALGNDEGRDLVDELERAFSRPRSAPLQLRHRRARRVTRPSAPTTRAR